MPMSDESKNESLWGDLERLMENDRGYDTGTYADSQHETDVKDIIDKLNNVAGELGSYMGLAEQLTKLSLRQHEDYLSHEARLDELSKKIDSSMNTVLDDFEKRFQEIENRLDTEINDALDRVDTKLETIDGILVPVTGIVMFSGSFGGTKNRFPIDGKTKKVMTSWCICDGVTTNGIVVPDLRNRFIIGSGSTYRTNDKGGEKTHKHDVSGSFGEATLTVEQLAVHRHGTSGGNWTGDWRPYHQRAGALQDGLETYDAGGSAPRSHNVSGVETSSASSLPPYYALAFIMRVA